MSLAMAYTIRKAAQKGQSVKAEAVEAPVSPSVPSKSDLAARVLAARKAKMTPDLVESVDDDFLIEDLLEEPLEPEAVDPAQARKAKIAAIMSKVR